MSAQDARWAELRAAWKGLDGDGRDEIRASVRAEHPDLGTRTRMFESLCLAALEGRLGLDPVPEGPPPSPILGPDAKPYTQGKPLEKRRPRLMDELVDDLEEEEETYLWPGRIPRGTCTAILGRMGDGKSTLLGWLAANASRGDAWPDAPDDNEPGSVLILQAEESARKAIKPRLSAFGFARGKIRVIKGINRGDDRESWFSLGSDVEALADRCKELGDVRLILIDPMGSYLRGINGYNENETRAYLQPLFDLADDQDLAVVAAVHPNKDTEKDILDRASGTGAFLQMCRMSWYLSVDPTNRSRRLLSLLKTNCREAVRTALALHYDAKRRRLTWFSEPIDLDARQVDHLLQKEAREAKLNVRRGPDPAEAKKAEEFLLGFLEKGPCLQSAAEDQALNAGVKGSTFRRALKRLLQSDGRLRRDRRAEDGRWWLTLEAPPATLFPGPDDPPAAGEAPPGDGPDDVA